MNELLAGLSQPDLEAIYGDAPGVAERLGIQPANPEDWERWRKYAYSKHRENRLAEDRPLSADEVEEWRAFVQLDFLNNVASSVIGEAARRNLLSEDALRTLPGTAGLTPYASRQLQARSALSRLPLGPALVDELLDLRAHWALHELLLRPLSEDEIALLAAAAQDPRLARTERHHLREALRKRGK
jgi:hypothetical protein